MDDAPSVVEMRDLHMHILSAKAAYKRGDVESARLDCNAILERLADRRVPYRAHFLNEIERMWERAPGPAPSQGTRLAGADIWAELHTSLPRSIRRLGAPAWSPKNRRPLARHGMDTPAIWTCATVDEHPDWQATVWEIRRGRPCPSCLRDAGLPADYWKPPDIPSAPIGRGRVHPSPCSCRRLTVG